ncbi:MAG: NAD(P)H-dependent oxidoreductase [Butyrivibrio sp.]|jgi:FMN-dependent NADH-azoreductase|nr:NAD(P)H-dependent oxidoreductase [Butyrivibrio sp.]
MKLLYVNACVRSESRTNQIAGALISKISRLSKEGKYNAGGENSVPEVEECRLMDENLLPMNEQRLDLRSRLIAEEDFSHPMFRYARQFAAADVIVMAAPYWDGSFPALLKIYIENIYVTGIVSRYGEDGHPCGMCRAKELFYVTTAGGPYKEIYSYGYLKELAVGCFGILQTRLIMAQMLDVDGYDAAEIVKKTIQELPCPEENI